MIKIVPSGNAVKLTLGLKPSRTRTVHGRLGEGSREHEFNTATASVKAVWKDNVIEANLRAHSDVFVSRITLSLHFRSTRPAAETAVWTDTAATHPGTGRRRPAPGSLTTKMFREGAGALWLSETPESEGILFRQSPPAEYPITFECHPVKRVLEITWNVSRRFETGESLTLPPLRMAKGERTKLIGTWRREWRSSSPRTPAPDRRIGWREDGEAPSPKDLREVLSTIRGAKIPIDWYALGPGYATETGDWLVPNESYRDRMGSASRSIGEQSVIPGLRFAPFLMSRKSALAAEHRDWAVKSAGGSPLTVAPYGQDRDPSFVLDITRTDVQNHLRKTFLVMRDQWGFRAFVLDRLDDLAIPGTREENDRGPGYLFDTASALIREWTGNRVYLAASGIPLQVSAGLWDARIVAPAPSTKDSRTDRRSLQSCLDTASALLHRAPWSEGAWANGSGPMPIGLFRGNREAAACTLLEAAAISSGMTMLAGDPRDLDDTGRENIRDYLSLFVECRSGKLRLAENVGGGVTAPMVVRNEAGWIGLFNFSGRKKEVRLDRDALRSALGTAPTLSAGDGAVFNSPEIHVALPARGHRLFRG